LLLLRTLLAAAAACRGGLLLRLSRCRWHARTLQVPPLAALAAATAQAYKLLKAQMLVEISECSSAHKYCEHILAEIKVMRGEAFNPFFVAQLQVRELTNRWPRPSAAQSSEVGSAWEPCCYMHSTHTLPPHS
jgi:hypothetical protein